MTRVVLIISLLQIVAFWKILGRMGFPPWLAILASIPVANLVLLYYVALNPWPRDAGWNGPGSGGAGGQSSAKF